MSEISLEEILSEKAFAEKLSTQAEMLFRLGNALALRSEGGWNRGEFFQLISEADGLEALLDDHGARYNRTFCFLRELMAALRSFALAGFSLAHLEGRFESYGIVLSMRELDQAAASIRASKRFVETSLQSLLEAARDEGRSVGVRIPTESFPDGRYGELGPRQKLPRNMGMEELVDDEQKVAEVASKYIQACAMLEEIGVHRMTDDDERERWLRENCSEEKARVYEASVHNLQSAYDTHVKNSPAEGSDPRLGKLRGHVSATLHLLEAVTHLVHFVERHESGQRNETIERRLSAVVRRSEVREATLNHMLYWATTILRRGRPLAEDLLPSYTNVQVLEVELPADVNIHARPAALIVGIVNRYGTPVELEVEGARCSAASILELLVTVGSHPNARRFVFRGDVKPLSDIKLLFEHAVGEMGIQGLPAELAYLRTQD